MMAVGPVLCRRNLDAIAIPPTRVHLLAAGLARRRAQGRAAEKRPPPAGGCRGCRETVSVVLAKSEKTYVTCDFHK